MKKILLWDARFPDRAPRRLTVDDAIASAAIRAGVAAAVDPADYAALSAGGSLDASLLTEVVLQHGTANQGFSRVLLPYSVILVAAGLGLAASIGTPLTGVISTPVPTPVPAPSGSLPGKPTLAVASGNGSNTLTIADSSDGGNTMISHRLYVGTSAGNLALQGTIPMASGLIYQDVGLTNGVIRYYAVSAVNAIGEGPLSAVQSGTPQAGGATTNQQAIAALPSRPLSAMLGASRFRQGSFAAATGGNGTISLTASGQWQQANMLNPLFRAPAWYEPTASEVNSFNMNGMYFCADGDTFTSQLNRVPKVLASDAQLVIVNAALAGVQFNNPDGSAFSVNGYCDIMFDIVDRLIAGGKAVVVDELWERGSSAGGAWSLGTAPRRMVPAINQEIAARAAARGVPVLKVREKLVDINGLYTSNSEPLPGVTRGDTLTVPMPVSGNDSTHMSPLGAYIYGKVVVDTLAPLLKGPVIPSATDPTNYFKNPTMDASAATGTLEAGITGVAPDGFAIGRNGSVTAIAAEIVNKVPDNTALFGTASKRWLQITATGASGLSDTAREGTVINLPSATVPSSTGWYRVRYKIEVEAFPGWRGFPLRAASPTFSSSARSETAVGSSVNPGNTSVTPTDSTAMPLTPEAFTGWAESHPMKLPGSTTVQLEFRAGWSKADGVARFRITDIEVVPFGAADPNTLMFNEADTSPLTITSPAAFTAPEETSIALQVTASKFARWSLSGTDRSAGGFKVDGFGNLTAGALDFEAPADSNSDNVYNVTVNARSFDPASATVSQAITVQITDVDDGFSDIFNRTAGELSGGSPGTWEKQGFSTGGSLTLYTTGSNKYLGQVGGASEVYLAPAQGDTVEQRIKWDMRSTTTTGGPWMLLNYKDQGNWLGIYNNSGSSVQLVKSIDGTRSTIATYQFFDDYFSGMAMMAQRVGNIVTVYQRGVIIGTADIGGILLDAYRSGIRTGSGSFTFFADNWNNRRASPIAARVGLRALTMTPLTGAAGADYAGTIGNRVVNSDISLGTVKFSSDNGTTYTTVTDHPWIADGDFVRCPGSPVGKWQVSVVEGWSGAASAANSPRTTTFTVTFS